MGPLTLRKKAGADAYLTPDRSQRNCTCGSCPECKSKDKLEKVLARFEVKDRPDDWGVF
jgi:hypothetical protein